jgi:hypothetical protein
MKFAVVASNAGEYADPKLLVQLAREIESVGWDGFFIWDMLYSEGEPVVDTFVALSAIAVSTKQQGFLFVRLNVIPASLWGTWRFLKGQGASSWE